MRLITTISLRNRMEYTIINAFKVFLSWVYICKNNFLFLLCQSHNPLYKTLTEAAE